MDEQRDPGDVEGQVEDLLERWVDERIAGRTPDLEAMARTLPETARGRFRARALAQQYLLGAAEGAEVALDAYLARLPDETGREHFREVLRDAALARTCLPGELVPGTRLDGRYEILRELGHGGMGVVYAALDHELEREVAVKVLRLTAGGVPPGWDELFRRESRTLARLRSRNIVTIHDARRAERSYIVMDLVRGRDLLAILAEARAHPGTARLQPGSAAPSPNRKTARLEPGGPRGPEPLRRAVGRAAGGEFSELLGERTHARCVARIVRLIALTLEHAHGAGVIHRDLKPQNVMLVPGGEPVLLDFGLASWGQEGSEQGFRGTPEYMAPEQIERLRAGNDPRTDVYQLGLVLYELLALRSAFARREREELWTLFQRIQAGETRSLAEVAPGVPRALAAIAERAMEREPVRRYQTMQALRADIERYLARLPPREVALAPLLRVGMHVDHALHQPFTAVVGALGLAALLWARTPPWVPPELSVIQAEATRVTEIDPGQPIVLAEAGTLGLEVSAKSPTWLYVFQVFGASDEESAQSIRPVYPARVAEYVSSSALPPARGIELPRGEHVLACADLVDPESYEGFLVYACREPNEILEQWQRTLLELESQNGLPVTCAEARLHREMLLESLRGDPPGTLSREQRARAFGDVQAAERAGSGEERTVDTWFYRLLHRVERRADGRGSEPPGR